MALPRRPLFPGGLMPVTVSNEKLIQELIQLKKGGCVPVPAASHLPCSRSAVVFVTPFHQGYSQSLGRGLYLQSLSAPRAKRLVVGYSP